MEDNQSQKNAKEGMNSDFESEENIERKLLKEKELRILIAWKKYIQG